MGVTIKDDDRTETIIRLLAELNHTESRVGIFGAEDSEIVKIAGVHEFGCIIRPKKGKRLAVPLNKKARGASPREFNDLFTIKSANGNLFLVKKKGNKLEFMYWLAEQVTIPERSFIRKGFDYNKDAFTKTAEGLLQKVIEYKLTTEEFFELMGEYMSGKLKESIKKLDLKKNSSITLRVKDENNPLIETGRLRKSITHKAVKK